MADYGHPPRFGLSIDPAAAELPSALALARQADAAGLDYLAVQDHPYQPGFLDAPTLLDILALGTERISVVADVLDLQLRPPALVAKAAASLSVATGGRVQLGVGGGASPEAIAAMGGAPHRGADMVEFTEEAILLMRRALEGGGVRLRSRQHSVGGYQGGPVPPVPVEIWLGSQRRRMLEVTGRSSDGWISPLNIYVPPEEVPWRQELIDAAAREAGREPREVRRIYNVLGAIDAGPGRGLAGSGEEWIETLARWVIELGFDTFVFWPATDPAAQLELLASRVVPGVRERVAELRAS